MFLGIIKRRLLIIMLASTFILLLSLLWSYSLRRQVKAKTSELKHANEQLEFLVSKRTKELENTNRALKRLRRSLIKADDRLTELAEVDGVTKIAKSAFFRKSVKEGH